jgi:hypothetical protein
VNERFKAVRFDDLVGQHVVGNGPERGGRPKNYIGGLSAAASKLALIRSLKSCNTRSAIEGNFGLSLRPRCPRKHQGRRGSAQPRHRLAGGRGRCHGAARAGEKTLRVHDRGAAGRTRLAHRVGFFGKLGEDFRSVYATVGGVNRYIAQDDIGAPCGLIYSARRARKARLRAHFTRQAFTAAPSVREDGEQLIRSPRRRAAVSMGIPQGQAPWRS